MEERRREDGFETTFVVSIPRDEAWKRLEEAAPVSDMLPPPRAGQWWNPAVEAPADELEVVPGERLRARKAVEPCKGTEIVITMEDADTGTRITFVQTGFGPGFGEQRPWLESGWWSIRADLFVYFEHGVVPGRHLRPWAGIGCDVTESPGGLTLSNVQPGGFADQAGVRDGDLLLTLAGAPAVDIRELSILMRSMRPGAEKKARYLRGGEILSGAGVL